MVGLIVSAACLVSASWVRSYNCRTDVARSVVTATPGVAGGRANAVALQWDGASTVKVALPAAVHFQPKPDAEATVSGPAALASRVRLEDGRLYWDIPDYCPAADEITIWLTGSEVDHWIVEDAAQLTLSGIDQDAIAIELRGRAVVLADGAVGHLSLSVAGSGVADLSALDAESATARVAGDGQAAIAPLQDANISVAGSGTVRLHGRPARLRTDISGSGKVEDAP